MRHLFVPACVCLMTLAGPTGSESKLSIERFAGAAAVGKKIGEDAASSFDPAAAESTRDKSQSSEIPVDNSAVANELSLEPEARNDSHANVESETSDAASAPAGIDGPVPLPPVAKPVVERSREEICDTLTQAAHNNNVPVPFFIHLLFQESRFKAGVVSSAGAQGIAQFMPETAATMGLDNPFDPLQAIPAAARLLRSLAQQFGNLGLAAAAYNAGPRRIQDWLAKKGKLPQETQGYVATITGRKAENWTLVAAGSPALKLPRHAPCQEAAGLLAWNGPQRIPLPPMHNAPSATIAVAAIPPKVQAAHAEATPPRAKASKTSTHPAQVAAAVQDKAPAKPAPAHGIKAAAAQLIAAGHKRSPHKGERVAQN